MSKILQQIGYVRQAWLVVLLAILYGGALAAVETTLSPIIAGNRWRETEQVIPRLVEGGQDGLVQIRKLDLAGHDGQARRVYQVVGEAEKLLGWVIPADGQGFADRIELLVGLDPAAATITGLYVLDQKETPGLGNYIAEADYLVDGDLCFCDQFIGKTTDQPIEVVKTSPATGNAIKALSGATVSSRSVANIVNATIANLRQAIRDEAGQSRRVEPAVATPVHGARMLDGSEGGRGKGEGGDRQQLRSQTPLSAFRLPPSAHGCGRRPC